MTGQILSDAHLLGLGSKFTTEELIQAVVDWHFNPGTGSPFWLRRASELGFDPRRAVRTVSDLEKFPDLSAELATVPVRDLLPQGCRGPVRVFESGGTIGPPKRIIETGSRRRALAWVDMVMRRHGVARTGAWLHVGPTGPHIVGRSVGLLAQARGTVCFYLDFDPRWARRLISLGDHDGAHAYIEHILDQVHAVLVNQEVSVMVVTPPVLEAACARPDLEKLLQQRLQALIWTGTSMSEETLRLVADDIFADKTVIGWYGNSLMGIAPQRPPRVGDQTRCVFAPYHPFALVQVIDPATGQPAAEGERGRVRVNLLTRDMFLPNVVERDSVVALGSVDEYGPGLAGVSPYRGAPETIIEGVY
jgi:phenylacetate-coenzyme A ligase PaaK-like adenylate-forming protein